MTSPPVPVASPPDPPVPQRLVCANCGAPLSGEYCSACGQRHEPHVHTLAHFAGEAIESISHADSRLWRTLLYLITRPGFLTRQFFDGKRARFLPPFRLYLVISLLFFVVAGLPEGPALQIDQPTSTQEGLQDQNGVTEFCDSFKASDQRDNHSYARLQQLCRKTVEDRGTALYKEVVHNIPRAMFVFLPLLALVAKLMYWRPRRYYVEHLLFLIHNHAFVFLTLTVLTLLGRIPVVGEHLGLLDFLVWVYMIWYLFRAMRNVYGQSRGLTLLKYIALGFSYALAGITVLLLTTVYTALTFA